MESIDVTNTRHLAFLHFMRYKNELYYARNINSCEYISLQIRAILKLIFCVFISFTVSALLTWAWISTFILMYHGLLSTPEVIFEGYILVAYIFNTVLIISSLAWFFIIFGISAFKYSIVRRYILTRIIKKLPKSYSGEKSSLSKLYDSIKNKYCVPVKVK